MVSNSWLQRRGWCTDSKPASLRRYPDIEYKEMIVDNACMQLVRLMSCLPHKTSTTCANRGVDLTVVRHSALPSEEGEECVAGPVAASCLRTCL